MKIYFLLISLIGLFSNEALAQNVLQEKIKNSVAFRDAAEKLQLEPGSTHVVNTTFVIDHTGVLEDITAESEYPELEIIALNILKSLPPEQAPKHNSEIKNRITLPMQFYVETEKNRAQRLRREARSTIKN